MKQPDGWMCSRIFPSFITLLLHINLPAMKLQARVRIPAQAVCVQLTQLSLLLFEVVSHGLPGELGEA